MVSDQRQVLELLVAEVFWVRKITDIDDVCLQQLVERPPGVAVDDARCDRPLLYCGEAMWHETLGAQFDVDLAHARLVFVERDE